MTKPSPDQIKRRALASERHKARHFAMQGLYQWHHTAAPAHEIDSQFQVDFNMKGTDLEYFHELLAGVQRSSAELDKVLAPYSEDRSLDECDPISLSLLRLATYELKNRIDVPYKVAINEAVNLAKKFGPEDSHKYVNGILDKVARELRALEVSANQQ